MFGFTERNAEDRAWSVYNSFTSGNMGLLSSAANGIGGALINGLFNIGSAKRQFNRQKELMQMQYDLNEQAAQADFQRQMQFYTQQRNDQNSYNDPKNVKARYEAAGINANAAFGTAGSYSPQQSPSGSVGSQSGVGLPTVPAFNMDPLQGALAGLQLKKLAADTAKTEADTANVEADTQNKEKQNVGLDLDNELKSIGIDTAKIQKDILAFDAFVKEQTLPDTIQQAKEQTNIMQQTGFKILQEGTHYLLENSLYNDKRDQMLAVTRKILTDCVVNETKVLALQKGIQLDDAKINLLTQQASKVISEKDLIDVQKKIADRTYEYMPQENIRDWAETAFGAISSVGDLVGAVKGFGKVGFNTPSPSYSGWNPTYSK